MFINKYLTAILFSVSLFFTSSYEIDQNISSVQIKQIEQTKQIEQLSYYLPSATNGVWLSGASYCDKESYKTMIFGGPVSDFKVTNVIYDVKTDMQGYIGILPSTKSIYVVFRGSSSALNWLDDFEVKLTSYDSYPECGCKVHTGFYHTTLAIKDEIINSINALKKLYPTYNVMCSGHSLGAIIALLVHLELEKVGIKATTYNYGQPRGGDKIFASFVNSKLPLTNYYRFVHNKDMVPHTPPIDGFGYYHACTEIFEDEKETLTTCSTSNCEDPKCSDKYSLVQTNTADHSIYLGHLLQCEASTL